jgi:hypothetical protein
MVHCPPARQFQPVEMNNTSMDLGRVRVKREMTEDTKKIHNGGTKITSPLTPFLRLEFSPRPP